MKNSSRVTLLSAVCAGCCFATFTIASAEEPVVPQPAPLSTESIRPVAPVPEVHSPVIPVTTPAPLAPDASPSPGAAVGSPVPFNAQNKEVAKQIYGLLKDIQESEFDPEKDLAAIMKLQEAVVQSDFNNIAMFKDYIKSALTLNTLRSKDIKTQRGTKGNVNKENGNKTGGQTGIGPFLNVSMGGSLEKSNTQKNETQDTSDVSISSSNDPAVLDKARQQQAVAYGLTLNEMKRLGFARPVDAKKVHGRWKWRCNEDAATYEFDFKPDGTVYIKLNADNPSKWRGHGFVNKGRGQWKVDYRSLTLELNDVNLAGFWTQHALIFFAGKEITSIDDEKMLLATDEDNELKRIAETKK